MNQMREAVGALADEQNVATALKASLAAIPGVELDDETEHDMIEGETSLHELLETVVAFMTDTEVMIAGLDAKITEFEARKKRYADRRAYLRSAIEQAMVIGNMKKKEFPDCTLSLADRAAGVVITDESRIPAEFFRTPDPEVKKKELLAALKAGQKIEGACLGNGGVSLTVRRS